MSKESKPEGYHSVIPYLTVHKPAELIDFVKHSFGAVEHSRTTGSAGGMHAEVQIGDSMVMIGGAEHITPAPTAIHLYVADVDDAYRRALEAGGKSLFEVADQPYGERSGAVEDIHGNRWYIAQRMGEGSVRQRLVPGAGDLTFVMRSVVRNGDFSG